MSCVGSITVIKKNGKDGPKFLLEPSKRTSYTIGSAESNHIRMALADVSAHHAVISIDPQQRRIFIANIAHSGGSQTLVNQQPLPDADPASAMRHLLRHDDVFCIANRSFRVEYETEPDACSFSVTDKPSPSPSPSTPVRMRASCENSAPLAVISASPSPSSAASVTPKRKARGSNGRDSSGNTGSTLSSTAQPQYSHTSTPTPNRRRHSSSTKQPLTPTQQQQRASSSPASRQRTLTKPSPSPSPEGKSGTGAAAGRRKSGEATPRSAGGKKGRGSLPATPTKTPKAATPSPSPPAAEPPSLPSPAADVEPAVALSAAAEASPLRAAQEEEQQVVPSSPQSIRDISAAAAEALSSSSSSSSSSSAASASSSLVFEELPAFELPMCSGPLSTLVEDPEEEDDPPHPHTRRFLPTPVRREVEEKAAAITRKVRDAVQTVTAQQAAARGQGKEEEQQEEESNDAAAASVSARVSVGDGDVCHVDEEIVLSPGTLQREELQLRHSRYGRVIRQLKERLAALPAKQQETDAAAAAVIVDTNVADMETEQLTEQLPASKAVTEAQAAAASETDGAGDQPASQPASAAEEEDAMESAAFLPVAEILAHESSIVSRKSLPAHASRRRASRTAAATGRASAAAVFTSSEELSLPSFSLPVAEADAEQERAAVDRVGVVADDQTVTLFSLSFSTVPISRQSLPAAAAKRAQRSRRATAAPALSSAGSSEQQEMAEATAAAAEEASPASPPLSATISLTAVPSTPTSPSKHHTAHRRSLRSQQQSAEAESGLPRPPALPTPVRRAIQERRTKDDAAPSAVPLLSLPTPLKKQIRSAREQLRPASVALPVAQTTTQPSAEPQTADGIAAAISAPTTSRHSLPVTSESSSRRQRKQSQRLTAQPVLSSPSEESSPSSPPATAIISLDDVPLTPCSPHKTAVSRPSLRGRPAETDGEEQCKQEAVDQLVGEAATDTEMATTEDADSTALTAAQLEEPNSQLPVARQSLPLQAAAASASGHGSRRQTALPTPDYVDDSAAPSRSLPSPLRRGIEQRQPRAAVSLMRPLPSPVRRDIRRGLILRPAPSQPATEEKVQAMADAADRTAAPAAEPQQDAAAEQLHAEKEDTAEVTPAILSLQPTEEDGAAEKETKKTRKRKAEKADPTAAVETEPVAAAEPVQRKRSRRGKETATASAMAASPAVPAAVVADSSSSSPVPSFPLLVAESATTTTTVVRRRKGKGELHGTIAEAVQVEIFDTAAEAEVAAPTRTRKRKGSRIEAAAPAPPLLEAPSTRSRRTKRDAAPYTAAAAEPEVTAISAEVDTVPEAATQSQRRGRARRAAAVAAASTSAAQPAAPEEQPPAASMSRTRQGRSRTAEPQPAVPQQAEATAAEQPDAPAESRRRRRAPELGAGPSAVQPTGRGKRTKAAEETVVLVEPEVQPAARRSRRGAKETEDSSASQTEQRAVVDSRPVTRSRARK